jgi:hypothetical protein
MMESMWSRLKALRQFSMAVGFVLLCFPVRHIANVISLSAIVDTKVMCGIAASCNTAQLPRMRT